MKQMNVLTKNNDFLNVMFPGTPCISKVSDRQQKMSFFVDNPVQYSTVQYSTVQYIPGV